jgi:HAD superfamily hydrolase (TIGR01549 family)
MNHQTKNIKAILFDLDGTLRHHLPSGGGVFMEHLQSIGMKFSAEDDIRAVRWEHFYFANSPEIQTDKEEFKDTDAFWVNFSARRLTALGLSQSQAVELAPQVSAHMQEFYKPEVHVPHEVPQVLGELKEKGYVLGVVSNRDEPYHEELKNLELDSFFKFSLAGGEVNSFKPEPRIFERGLELAGTSPHETMYIGDNYFADIVGSHRAGLTPVLYDPITVFPDAECAVIKSFDELHDLLKENNHPET